MQFQIYFFTTIFMYLMQINVWQSVCLPACHTFLWQHQLELWFEMKHYPMCACSSYPAVGPFITSWKQAFYVKKLLCSGIWQKGHNVCIMQYFVEYLLWRFILFVHSHIFFYLTFCVSWTKTVCLLFAGALYCLMAESGDTVKKLTFRIHRLIPWLWNHMPLECMLNY
jgi:hypothetical protein